MCTVSVLFVVRVLRVLRCVLWYLICDLCVVVLERLSVFCCLSYARDVSCVGCVQLCFLSMSHGVCST